MLKNYSIYPFKFDLNRAGGLPSVFLREINSLDKEVILFSPGENNTKIKSSNIICTSLNGIDQVNLNLFFFGCGCYQYLHPEAHIDVSGDPIANREMLEINNNNFISYNELYSFLNEKVKYEEWYAFNDRFDCLIDMVQPNNIFNWQDYFFLPSIIKHAKRLNEIGVFQTFHLHTSFPLNLSDSIFGNHLMEAMSLVDVVYLHTDDYITRAQIEFEKTNLKAPKFKRFDLGIDKNWLDKNTISTIGFDHYEEIINRLVGREKKMVESILDSENKIPHRFICLDRIDPSKGTVTLVRAVIKYLDGLITSGVSISKLIELYRFYFIQPNINLPYNPNHMKNGGYAKILKELFNYAEKKFSDIIFVSDSIDRSLLPIFMKGAHGMTGGAQDGLNLTIQENLYVNRNHNTSIICGDGAGFAIHIKTLGLDKCAFFPKAGCVDDFVQSINDIVLLQSNGKDKLIFKKKQLVDHVIERNDSIIVGFDL